MCSGHTETWIIIVNPLKREMEGAMDIVNDKYMNFRLK